MYMIFSEMVMGSITTNSFGENVDQVAMDGFFVMSNMSCLHKMSNVQDECQ